MKEKIRSVNQDSNCRDSDSNVTSVKTLNAFVNGVASKKDKLTPLLSRKAAEKMKVIKVNYEKFESVSGVVEDKHDTPQDFPGALPGSVQLT